MRDYVNSISFKPCSMIVKARADFNSMNLENRIKYYSVKTLPYDVREHN